MCPRCILPGAKDIGSKNRYYFFPCGDFRQPEKLEEVMLAAEQNEKL